MSQTKGAIGVTTENIFPIIKKFLYSDHEIFLRELVSNAVDATTKLSTLSRLGEASGELGTLQVRVELDEDKKTLTISDNGVGMTAQEVNKYINQIAFSGAEEFMAKYKDQSIIGHFGLGFYSAFMVAEKVEIFTKSHKADAPAQHWVCDGSPEYTLEQCDKSSRGTDIVLHIAQDSLEFASKTRIEGLLKKYCSFLPVEIVFGKKQQWKDEKWVETDEDNLINDTTPLWTQRPSEITPEQYTEFYHKLYPMADEPLFNIHLNVDYPFTLTGILYFPRLKNNFEVQKNKIQLYCNQVFVTDSVEGIVPEFLTLLHGVIDSPDIPLNVSRSYLQSDSNVKKISSHITKKVSDRLVELFKENRADYEAKWDDLRLFIQYGVVSEPKFGERVGEFSLLKNSEGKYFTLEEYSSIIKDTQTDKNGKIVHLYTTDATEQHSFVSEAKAQGYDVLVMDSPLDGHFISFLENKFTDWSFVRVDANVASRLIDKGADESMALSSEQQEQLKPLFTELLPVEEKVNYTVEFSAMGETSAPIVVTQNEFMRRMRDMSRVGGGGGMNFYGEMPDSYTVMVNGNHPLVVRMVAQSQSEPSQAKAEMSQLVDLALLSAGLLKGEKLSEFVKRSISMI